MPTVSGFDETRTGPREGRRVRNMQEKAARIFEAAAALFAERGFDAVTTQQISDRADVAAGTLFRYASSKGELLLMVYNEQFRAAIEAGKLDADRHDDLAHAVYAQVIPILTAAADRPDNAVMYQRELLFGSATERYRAEGLAQVEHLEAAIAERLSAAVRKAGAPDDPGLRTAALRAARSVFAVLHLLLAQPATGAQWGDDPRLELKEQVAQIIAGFQSSVRPHAPH